MLRIIDGRLEVENLELEREVLKERLVVQEQERALMTVYLITGDPNPSLPFNGLLTERLRISSDTAYDLIRSGRLGFFCAGKKNYRVSERHAREFEGTLNPAA